jgi:hypothetical protein
VTLIGAPGDLSGRLVRVDGWRHVEGSNALVDRLPTVTLFSKKQWRPEALALRREDRL